MVGWVKKRESLLLTLAVTLAGFVLYTLTAAPSVLMADSGEFQFVPYLAGVAHPTGYPLYTMAGWAWTHLLPIGNVAYRMNLFSALWGGITVGLVCQVALWSLRLVATDCPAILHRSLALLTASVMAVSATFWSQANIAEVYTLNSAFLAAVLYLALRTWHASMTRSASAKDLTGKWLLALSVVYGFSLTHHRTMLLMLPGLAIFLWLALRQSGLRWQRVLYWVLPGLLLPQLMYLWIPWRAPYTPYLEMPLGAGQTLTLYEKTLSGFLDLALGGAFGGQLAGGPLTADRLTMTLTLLRQQFTWVGIVLGVVGLVRLLRRHAWPVLALTVIPYLTYVAFNLAYFIGDIYVLFIPSYLIFAVWIGLGSWEVADTVSALIVHSKKSAVRPEMMEKSYQALLEGARTLTAAPLVALSFGLPLALLVGNYPVVDQSRNLDAPHLWENILAQPLPERAILVSNDRDEIMPLWYYQYVDGVRADLLGLFPLIVRQPGFADVVQAIDRALETGRPVYLIKPMAGLELKYRLEAKGPLVQVVASQASQQPGHPLSVAFGSSLRLVGYDQVPGRIQPGTNVEVTLFWECTSKMDRTYSSFVHLLDSSSKAIANHDHRPGDDYYPTTLWKPGEVLLDRHTLSIPPGIAPGVYRLVAGLYVWPSMDRLGEEAVIGQIVI